MKQTAKEVVSLPCLSKWWIWQKTLGNSSVLADASISSITTVLVAGTKTGASFLTPKDPRKMRPTGRKRTRSSTPNIAAAAGSSGTSSSSRCLSPCSSSCTPSSPVSLLYCSAMSIASFHSPFYNAQQFNQINHTTGVQIARWNHRGWFLLLLAYELRSYTCQWITFGLSPLTSSWRHILTSRGQKYMDIGIIG